MENNSQIIIYTTETGETKTCKDFLQVGKEGGRSVERNQKFYNLDAIISVGYRIKSVATRFRQWATQHIKEYIVKGFVMDDERLKNPELKVNSNWRDSFGLWDTYRGRSEKIFQ